MNKFELSFAPSLRSVLHKWSSDWPHCNGSQANQMNGIFCYKCPYLFHFHALILYQLYIHFCILMKITWNSQNMEKFQVEMLSKETISATMSRAPKEGRAVKRGLNSSYQVLNVIQLEILAIMSQYMCFNVVAALQLHTTFMNYDRLRTTSGHSSNLCSF